jgi:hypothetical protein
MAWVLVSQTNSSAGLIYFSKPEYYPSTRARKVWLSWILWRQPHFDKYIITCCRYLLTVLFSISSLQSLLNINNADGSTTLNTLHICLNFTSERG